MASIYKLNYKNVLVQHLVADSLQNSTPRQVLGSHFSFTATEAAPNPKLISYSLDAARLIGLDITDKMELLSVVSGNSKLPSWTLAYGGHQFGHWAGQLGDGRAISIGQVLHNQQVWEMQLKGAGKTPYSRFGDGYAVLRSSIREYLASEAMHALNIPTSRALSLVSTSTQVQRETIEQGAIVCRLAPTWIRFGNFELFRARGDLKNLKILADYCIKYHFPDISPGSYIDWISEVVRKTAIMIAHWQAIGFCHGVMNTDNFSIMGITIDYGPFQFLDAYDTGYICNHSDPTGRYAFGEQPKVGMWNLTRLVSAILPLISENDEPVDPRLFKALNGYKEILDKKYRELMCARFGVDDTCDERFGIIMKLLELMQEFQLDYTLTMRALAEYKVEKEISSELLEKLRRYSYNDGLDVDFTDKVQKWWALYYAKFQGANFSNRLRTNPKYILRNHMVAKVIKEVEPGDAVNRYLSILQNPWEGEHGEFAEKAPSLNFQCSCSS